MDNSTAPSVPSCPSSGLDNPYIFCQCNDDPNNSSICWLWGVPWYWLAFTLAIWILAIFAAKIIDLLVAIISIFMRRLALIWIFSIVSYFIVL